MLRLVATLALGSTQSYAIGCQKVDTFQDMYRLNGQYPVWEQIQVAIRGPALIQRYTRPIG